MAFSRPGKPTTSIGRAGRPRAGIIIIIIILLEVDKIEYLHLHANSGVFASGAHSGAQFAPLGPERAPPI